MSSEPGVAGGTGDGFAAVTAAVTVFDASGCGEGRLLGPAVAQDGAGPAFGAAPADQQQTLRDEPAGMNRLGTGLVWCREMRSAFLVVAKGVAAVGAVGGYAEVHREAAVGADCGGQERPQDVSGCRGRVVAAALGALGIGAE